jgi:hypothetical protein
MVHRVLALKGKRGIMNRLEKSSLAHAESFRHGRNRFVVEIVPGIDPG